MLVRSLNFAIGVAVILSNIVLIPVVLRVGICCINRDKIELSPYIMCPNDCLICTSTFKNADYV